MNKGAFVNKLDYVILASLEVDSKNRFSTVRGTNLTNSVIHIFSLLFCQIGRAHV